jgi:methionine sulfoxide reductase heme-binding subunit
MIRRWPLLLGLIAGLIALRLGLSAGANPEQSWQLAARWTARVGFPVFIIAYSASSLGRLWPGTLTRTLWRDRRWWGLGFAASHTVHLYALLTYISVAPYPLELPILIGGGGGYFMLYLMALTSNDAAMRALGRNWKRLHTLGIHWLWFVFAFSYFGRVAAGEDLPYAAFALTVALGALGLRIAVWVKGRNRRAAA